MWYIILSFVLAIYISINLSLPYLVKGFIGTYVIQPALWASIALLTFKISKYEGLNILCRKIRRWQFGNSPVHSAILIASLQITLLMFAGIFFGFGKSPYSFSPAGILINIVFVSSQILGIEFSRAYLTKKFITRRRNITAVILLVALFFTLISIPLMKFTIIGFDAPAESAKFIGSTCIPSFVQNLLASYLASFYGALASIAYIGTLKYFEWFSPILPDLEWTTKALIETIVPTIGFLALQYQLIIAQSGGVRIKMKKEANLSSTAFAIISVVILYFSIGFLGVRPVIVSSGSMRPAMDVGDVAIVSSVSINKIEKGDIIQFRKGNYTVMHRVIEVKEEGSERLFITKGDANKDPDVDPVHPNQVIGKVVFVIPKIGWISIFIKEIIRSIVKWSG